MKYWVSFIFVFWVVACSQPKKTLQEEVCFSDTIKYAKGFSVRYFEDYTAVDIRDPWDSTRLLQRYLLVDRNKVIPKKLPTGTVCYDDHNYVDNDGQFVEMNYEKKGELYKYQNLCKVLLIITIGVATLNFIGGLSDVLVIFVKSTLAN